LVKLRNELHQSPADKEVILQCRHALISWESRNTQYYLHTRTRHV